MSLSVHVYFHDELGKKQFLRHIAWKDVMQEWRGRELSSAEMAADSKRLLRENEAWRKPVGPEAWRTMVYGSPFARSLGLALLPTLAQHDLDVQGDDLNILALEVEVLVSHVDQLAIEVDRGREDLLSPLTNIANAIVEAQGLSGGVVVW